MDDSTLMNLIKLQVRMKTGSENNSKKDDFDDDIPF